MTFAFLLQTLASFAAILLLVALAAWAGIARAAPALDPDTARALIADEFPDHRIDAVWVAADGGAAVARSEDEALIVYRSGDGYVARSLPWDRLATGRPANGAVALGLGDLTAPRARFALAEGASWPPGAAGEAAR